MKGIILAGGNGTRLSPLTLAFSKQLMPVYDKPTIYYSLSVLMLAGIREILIISTPRDLPHIEELLGSGQDLGLKFQYMVQKEPKGIAEALILAEDFYAGGPVTLILGDNILYGHNLTTYLQEGARLTKGARVCVYRVRDPQRYGVATFDKSGRVLALDEKPAHPKSDWAVTGLYFYDQYAGQYARKLKPSARGELEITDLNRMYLERGELQVTRLHRGIAWLDTGTFDSLMASSQFVQTLEKRQGLKIACIEEIALKMGFIDLVQFGRHIDKYAASEYGGYLRQIWNETEAERSLT